MDQKKMDAIIDAAQKNSTNITGFIEKLDYINEVFDGLYVLVGILDSNGVFIDSNQALLDSARLKKDDVVGIKLEDSIWWSYSQDSKNNIKKMIKEAVNGKKIRRDAIARLGQNRFAVLDFGLYPVIKEGIVKYIITSAVDVTDRIEALSENRLLLRELNKEKQRFESIINNTPGIVWERDGAVLNKQTVITYINNHAKTMLGYNEEEMHTPGFWYGIIHPDDRDYVTKVNTEVHKGSGHGVLRYRLIDRKGKVIWVETRMLTIKNEDNEIMGVRGVTVDITDRIRLEQRKDEFISIASHELKTPLTTVSAYSQILEKKLERYHDEQLDTYLSKMNGYLVKLTKIINDFLDFSKIQSGKLTYEKKKININKLVSEVSADMQAVNDSHKIKTKMEKELWIVGDKMRLSQVLINLIQNAIKYSPEADKVEVSVESKDGNALVHIRDYGIGIEKESQLKLFERFYRVDNPKKIKIEGFGIGLYLSAEIIKRHGGKIWVKSEPGVGSTFSFSLPYINE